MEELKGKEYLRSNTKLLRFALKKWKFLLGIAITSGVLAAVLSGPKFITPEYTATAAIYPANLGAYADETELQQMQQYLESVAIRSNMINKFDLYEEYEIDSTIKLAKTYINAVYAEHVLYEETRFESIVLTAISSDPVKARDMVKELIVQLNTTIRETEREKYLEIVKITKDLVDEKRNQLDSLELLTKTLSTKYGVLDYVAQSEIVTEGYIQFLLKGKKGEEFDEVKQMYGDLQIYGRYFQNLQEQLFLVNEEYMDRLHDYEEATKNYRKVQTYSIVIKEPQIPDKKSYPIRWLIVLFAVAGSLGFTFAMLMILGYQKS